MSALQGAAAWAEERLLGAIRQPVPQNGRVHLHHQVARNHRNLQEGFRAHVLSQESYPKDPAALKTLRDSELLRRSVLLPPPTFTVL